MSKMGSHDPFGHLKHKLWPKERSRVKLAIWLPTTKRQKSTQFPCVQVVCNMPLKIYQRGLQLCFRPHPDRRFAHKVIAPQSRGNSNLGNFGTFILGVPRQKAIWMWAWCRVYYMGEGGGFLQVRAVVSLVSSKSPMARLSIKGAPTMY